jgi:hypothetical protein
MATEYEGPMETYRGFIIKQMDPAGFSIAFVDREDPLTNGYQFQPTGPSMEAVKKAVDLVLETPGSIKWTFEESRIHIRNFVRNGALRWREAS